MSSRGLIALAILRLGGACGFALPAGVIVHWNGRPEAVALLIGGLLSLVYLTLLPPGLLSSVLARVFAVPPDSPEIVEHKRVMSHRSRLVTGAGMLPYFAGVLYALWVVRSGSSSLAVWPLGILVGVLCSGSLGSGVQYLELALRGRR